MAEGAPSYEFKLYFFPLSCTHYLWFLTWYFYMDTSDMQNLHREYISRQKHWFSVMSVTGHTFGITCVISYYIILRVTDCNICMDQIPWVRSIDILISCRYHDQVLFIVECQMKVYWIQFLNWHFKKIMIWYLFQRFK